MTVLAAFNLYFEDIGSSRFKDPFGSGDILDGLQTGKHFHSGSQEG